MSSKIIKLIKIVLICFVILEMIPKVIVFNDYTLNTISDRGSTIWTLKWLKNKTSNNIKSVTKFKTDTYNEYLGWSPTKNYKSDDFNTNSIGIRANKEYSIFKKENILRIVTAGESSTLGERVKDNETYSYLMEKNIKNSEVMNFGGDKYGIDQISIRIEKDSLKFKPDIVICSFMQGDMYRSKLDFKDYMKPKYNLINNKLVLDKEKILEPDNFFEENKYNPSLTYLLKLALNGTIYNYSAQEYEELTFALWKKTVDDIRKINSLPVFVYLPHGDEMTDVSVINNYFEKIMYKFCEEEKINCFSGRKYISDKFKEGVEFDNFGPYEPKTHKIIADDLSIDLKKLYFIPESNIVLDKSMIF